MLVPQLGTTPCVNDAAARILLLCVAEPGALTSGFLRPLRVGPAALNSEIAAHLGVNRDTIYKWIADKQMPAYKVGRLWKFRKEEVDDWVRQDKAADRQRESTEE